MTTAAASIHAACVIIDEVAIVIRGAAGSGKSRLARRLVALAAETGRFAVLVGDDRIHLNAVGGRVLARGHAAIAGQQEVREIGILAVPHAVSGVVRMVVDIGAETAPRLPSGTATATLSGISLPQLLLSPHHAAEDAARLVLTKLSLLRRG